MARKKSKVRLILFILLLIVFLTSGGILVSHYVKGYLEEKAFHDLADEKGSSQEEYRTKHGVVLPEYVKLYKRNHDLLGWIKIPGTKLDYPVMQTAGKNEDPEFYLRRNFKKEYKISGTPFMDAKSDIFLPTSNWIVYGHNMNNGTMFADLTNYDDPAFFKEHRYIYFDTIYKKGVYKVFAGARTQVYSKDYDGFAYYNYPAITDEDEYDEYVENVKEISTVKKKNTPHYDQQLLTLSTCSYHLSDNSLGRYIVVAKEVNFERHFRLQLQRVLRNAHPWFKHLPL
ncbi:MAG: class B sortase [Firmicutes bacterium]|nr:class B sortase [Bacillota bacterium]